MSRPQKLTLDFFIHDAHASDDRKIRRLDRKHGNDGYATYFRLLEKCCQERGLRLRLKDSEEAEIAVEYCKLRDCQHLYSIIQSCSEIGLFNRQLWESEREVFSDAFHDRYVERLKQRKTDATRKRQSRAAKALQERIDELSPELSGVTTGLSRDSHEGRPPTEDQKTEVQRTEDRGQRTESSCSEDLTAAQPEVKTDRFFGQPKVVRRIEMVRTAPRWDEAAPWSNDDERKAFDDWLRIKYKIKNDPARYAAAIVGKVAKGEPVVDWEQFKNLEAGTDESQVLKDWATRCDWENFPLLDEWKATCQELGQMKFINLGGRDSPQHRFATWLKQQEVSCA